MSSSSAPPARQAKPPPNTTQTGKKRSRAPTVSTTDKVVHKTTNIPEPSLKPLLQRAYDRTDEEVKAKSAAKVKAHFAPKVSEPKPTYNEKYKKWAMDMLTTEPQYKRSLPSDYKHEIERQSDLAKKAKRSAKSRKQFPQLREQKNQSVPPLIITPPPPDIHMVFIAEMDQDRELLDPRVIAAAATLGMTVMKAKETAAE
jgi:hypothetical protein